MSKVPVYSHFEFILPRIHDKLLDTWPRKYNKRKRRKEHGMGLFPRYVVYFFLAKEPTEIKRWVNSFHLPYLLF